MSRIKTARLFLNASVMIFSAALAACGGGSSSNTSTSTPASVGSSSATSAGSITTIADPLLFSSSSYSIAQGQGSVSLTVLRVGDASAAVSVDYATVDGTAMAGADYVSGSGTLQWAENDSTPRTVAIQIIGSAPFTGNRAFNVELSNPSATAQIATPDSAVVTIAGTAGMSAGTVQLSDTAYVVEQSSDELTITVNRTGGASGAVSVRYATSDATAVAGADFTAAAGTLTWGDGDASSKTFTIPISSAKAFVGTKSLGVALSNATSGAALGTPASGTVTIFGQGSPAMGTLHLSANGYSISQSDGALTVSVDRAGGASGQVSVGYVTGGGTAVAGVDFTTTKGTLTWADGDSSAKAFSVPVSNATAFSGNRTFSIALINPVNGATISSPGNATVAIAGDAAAAVGNLHLGSAGYTVPQSAGTASVIVQRTGGSSGTVSVAYTSINGTGVAGIDYTATSGILQWADGDSASRTISIPISSSASFSGTKSFSISLSNAGGGASLGSPSTAGVSITGGASTATGSIQLSAATYSVAQNARTLTVTVNRTGGSSSAVSAAYATSNGTAVAGTDFTAANGTLSWASGDAKSKSFSVAISSATAFSGSRSFSLTLSHPGGGATLSSPSTAAVTISGAASATAGTLLMSSSTATVAQSDGSVVLTVKRAGSTNGAVSVAYDTNDGSATSGQNYTAAAGTLSWPDGDATTRSITIPINNSPFAGSKTFILALSNPSGGASVVNPSSTTVTIAGSGSSSQASAAPSAPSNLVMTGQTGGSISLSWGAATPGSNPVAQYKVYRNGSSYATSTGTSYSDNNASNATVGAFNGAATIYSYAVSAVDSLGNEGPQTSQLAYNVYYNGVFGWQGDYSYSSSINYKDTSGSPESGAYDMEVSVFGGYGGIQPYAGNTVPQWDLEAGAFGYVSIDLKPTMSGQKWGLSMISRLPPGDVYPWASVDVSQYGPSPVAGKWATYKIPLSALSIGKTSFEGSISGNTLTVTSVGSGVGVDAGGFITGNGVKPGTYIVGHGANGGPGTYTVSPSQDVASTSMTEQRTGVYKFDLSDQTGSSNNHYYVDNVRFTRQ